MNRSIRNILGTVGVASVFLLGLTLGLSIAEPSVTVTVESCVTEDSDNCYWDASTNGNGQGTSFVVVDGTVFYPKG